MEFFKKKTLYRPLPKNDDHQWIYKNKFLLESFKELFDQLKKKPEFYKQVLRKPLIFLRANGTWSITLESNKNQNIVIIFDELMKLLKSARPRVGQAILAHELGHIFYGHSGSGIDPLTAQVQADGFACELGYALEMKEVLEDFDFNNTELKVRVTYINSYIAETNPSYFYPPRLRSHQ